VPERVGFKVLPIPTKSRLSPRGRPEALGEEQEPPRIYAGEVSDVSYFNQARPHQGIQQQIPEPRSTSHSSHDTGDKMIAVPILGGLHHDYQRVS
jgi:hypothetical protein